MQHTLFGIIAFAYVLLAGVCYALATVIGVFVGESLAYPLLDGVGIAAVLFGVLLNIAGTGLSIVGLFERERKRALAVVGLLLNIGLLGSICLIISLAIWFADVSFS